MIEQSLPKRILMDLDNCLSDTRFNEATGAYDLGAPLPGMKDAVNRLARTNEIVIWTARPKKEHGLVREWLVDNGIQFNRIKKKPLAKLYVDDRAVDPQTFLEWHGDAKYDSSSAFEGNNQDND